MSYIINYLKHHMTAVIWCESVLTSVAVRTLEIAAARRCLKCGLRCKQPRFTSVSVLLKDSRVLSTVWLHCEGFPSHSGGQLWYKCLSWSSDAEKKVTARTKLPRHNMVFAQRVQYPAALITDRSFPTSNVYSLFCVYKGHYMYTHQPLLFFARWEIVDLFVWDSERTPGA